MTSSHPQRISIHALLAESDATNHDQATNTQQISIHALLAESDSWAKTIATEISNFYPRSPCGERRNVRPHTRQHGAISIHALLAESDRRGAVICYLDNIISIHALLAESDVFLFDTQQRHLAFLSTLSLRRATK